MYLKDMILFAMLTDKSPFVDNSLSESCLKVSDKEVSLISWNDEVTLIQTSKRVNKEPVWR